ncbi:MAG TPA: tyrosine--tRNA ligase [Stellaceae bacterium]|nr:tyrosine--tRNA ligase [Stellaceae bacterium]HMD66447.1 tyrosine--tRNA ligase [Stellaceae bacterium]
MSTPRSAFLRTAVERGFVHQCTDLETLDERLRGGRVIGYIGYDCTADSLHVGSLVGIMLLRLFQRCGHKPVVLMGGGTTRIGDPSGKDEARRMLDDAEIASNMAGIRSVFAKFIDFGDRPSDAIMVNNADWLDELRYIPLLRDIGRHFSVNRMLTQDSVRLRLERDQPLSFLEFNYPILQAYDFVELGRRFGCELQIGGSDQWGNIVGGVELGRRTDGRALFGLTTPLIASASGAKMGKSVGGAVWLNAEKLSAYEYWQFWRNTEDADVGRFLRLFTELPIDEIAPLERLEGSEINEAKKVLATEATALCHGREAAEAAAATAHAVFENGGSGSGLPMITVPRDLLACGIPAFELFSRAGLAASNGEARRLIRGGGARINDTPVENETRTVSLADLDSLGMIKLSAGRKRHALMRTV